MPTPLFVFRATFDSSTQDTAPSYALLSTAFASAFTRASAGFDPAKLRGLQWLGPGPRVTRRVHNGAPVIPGGVTSAVGVLGYDGSPPPSITLAPAQWSAFINVLRGEIRTQLESRAREEMFITGTGLNISSTATEYNPAVNGPASFWADPPYVATQTHTKDRFPAVNFAGDVSADQNENPVGPNDPNIVPLGTPDLNQPVQDVLKLITGTLKYVAIGAGVLGVLWLASSAVQSYRLSQATSALRDAQRGRARLNPSPFARSQEQKRAMMNRLLSLPLGHHVTVHGKRVVRVRPTEFVVEGRVMTLEHAADDLLYAWRPGARS